MKNTLADKAMIVHLNISQWTARKYDRKVSQKVAQDYNAESIDVGRYNKVLIALACIKSIQKIANEARIFHYGNTLPWLDGGARILPADNYLNYTQKIRDFKNQFETAVKSFCQAYPQYQTEAKKRLKGLYNASDYPAVRHLDSRYGFAVNISPLPDADDFRVKLNKRDVEIIQKDIEGRLSQATETANRDLWKRLYEGISHIANKLQTPDAIFRDSLINNVVELCDLLPALNITNDKDLESMTKKIQETLCTELPEALRKDPVKREETQKKASKILDDMSGYMGGDTDANKQNK